MPRGVSKQRAGRPTGFGSLPSGRVRITEALKNLLREKEFNAITWAEIAQTAGVNEALIYKYFRDKRNLLHQVLSEYLENYLDETNLALRGVQGAFNKLRQIIWSNFNSYNENRVFAKILLLEVRNFPGYFESETYQLVRNYAGMILEIIQDGAESGVIRTDVRPRQMRQILLGSLEHLCLPGLIFDRKIDPDHLTEEMCRVLFPGMAVDLS